MRSSRDVRCAVAPEPLGPAPVVADEVFTRDLRCLADDIIDRELQRLSRKAPSLSETDLQTVTRVLYEIVEKLLVGQAAALPHREPQLRDLFGLPETPLRGST